jgi:dephospho-CoA kinase
MLAVVLAPPDVRLARILARDGISREDAETRMRAQHPDSFYTDRADVVLVNDGVRDPGEEIRKITERLHK